VVAGGWRNEAEMKLLAEQSETNGSPSRSRQRIYRLDYVSFPTLVTLIRGARAVVFRPCMRVLVFRFSSR